MIKKINGSGFVTNLGLKITGTGDVLLLEGDSVSEAIEYIAKALKDGAVMISMDVGGVYNSAVLYSVDPANETISFTAASGGTLTGVTKTLSVITDGDKSYIGFNLN